MQDKAEEVLLCTRPSNRGCCVSFRAPLSSPSPHCPPRTPLVHGTCHWRQLPGTRWNGSFSILHCLHYRRNPPVLSKYSPASPAAQPAITSVLFSILRRNPRLFLPSEYLKLQLTRRGRSYCISIASQKPVLSGTIVVEAAPAAQD